MRSLPVRPGMIAGADWWAIGCDIRVVVSDRAALEPARRIVAAHVEDLDLAASRFRSDSDLSRVNANAGRPVQVGPVLLDAVRVALDAARRTAGDVDPTVGGVLVDLGYDRTFTQVAGSGPAVRVSVRRAAGWQAVVVDDRHSTVQVPDGVLLDLGATAKAFGSDRAAAAVHAELGVGVLVSLGGDIAVAGPPPQGVEPDGRTVSGWAVRVADAAAPEAESDAPVVLVTAGGLATSSVSARKWHRGGQELHHVVDPKTNLPAVTPWRSVTVAAPSCLEANIATTAAIVRGASAASWLRATGLPARLIGVDGAVLTLNGWPSE